MQGKIVCSYYKIQRELASGAFGVIYLVRSERDKQAYAAKMEGSGSQLSCEAKVYKYLSGGVGIPKIYCQQYDAGVKKNVLIMDLLGPSIEELFCFCGRQLGMKTTLMLAEQMISRLEFIHSKGLLHRDQKPDNYCVGIGRAQKLLYLIDFGLSKKFLHQGQHIPYIDKKPLIGTARYCSINSHLGIEQSRRDDLESLGYILIYLLKGSLPWQGLKPDNKKTKFDKILEKKSAVPVEQLCRGLPQQFVAYIHYCRGLRFDDSPDYAYLKKIFRELFQSNGFVFDHQYDWILQNIDVNKYVIEGQNQEINMKLQKESFIKNQCQDPIARLESQLRQKQLLKQQNKFNNEQVRQPLPNLKPQNIVFRESTPHRQLLNRRMAVK